MVYNYYEIRIWQQILLSNWT